MIKRWMVGLGMGLGLFSLQAQAELVDTLGELTVIPPFITEFKSRYQATMANFCLGVMPPSPILGLSLL